MGLQLLHLLVHADDAVLGRRGVRCRIPVHVFSGPVMVVRRPQQHARTDDRGPAVVILRIISQPVHLDPVGSARVEHGVHRDARERGVGVDAHDGCVLRRRRPSCPEKRPLSVPHPRVQPCLSLTCDDGRHSHHPIQVHLHHRGCPLCPRTPEPDVCVPAHDDDRSWAVFAVDKIQRPDVLHGGQFHLDKHPRRGTGAEDAKVSVPSAAEDLVLPLPKG
mmetsp:Transcript_32366/g.66914  ORF Transcript_32366/g.66914 Transcript_32366/m.66914 type:complete len:219 (-) Transcript_32366:643-1299(-)